MSVAIFTLVGVVLLVTGLSLVAPGFFHSAYLLSGAWERREASLREAMATHIAIRGTAVAGPLVDITVGNDGQAPLLGWEGWDVIVQYYAGDGTYHQRRLSYTTAPSPGDNQWVVVAIYRDATTTEAFQPGILDPGEEVVLRARLSPAARRGEGRVLVATPQGVTASAPF